MEGKGVAERGGGGCVRKRVCEELEVAILVIDSKETWVHLPESIGVFLGWSMVSLIHTHYNTLSHTHTHTHTHTLTHSLTHLKVLVCFLVKSVAHTHAHMLEQSPHESLMRERLASGEWVRGVCAAGGGYCEHEYEWECEAARRW